MQRDGTTWGGAPAGTLAHSDEHMSCYTCHTSWMTSCFGCHLSMKANANRTALHYEGDATRRTYTSYNFQVLRDDVFMLGLDSTAKKNRIAPVRVVQRGRRQLAERQPRMDLPPGADRSPPRATAGRRSIRTTRTPCARARRKTCTDCHVSRENDNNAWMAQLLLQGTNFVNFMGRYVYVGEGRHGFEAVAVTEHDEPQAVIGSYLQKLAYPENFARHQKTQRAHRGLRARRQRAQPAAARRVPLRREGQGRRRDLRCREHR